MWKVREGPAATPSYPIYDRVTESRERGEKNGVYKVHRVLYVRSQIRARAMKTKLPKGTFDDRPSVRYRRRVLLV